MNADAAVAGAAATVMGGGRPRRTGVAEWFEEWFDETYLHLYPHRNDQDAEALVGLLQRVLPWSPGWRVLDVGCGAGRHLRALSRLGARPIGLDLSPSLLRRAQQLTGLPVVRGDMRRLPVRPGSMDLTVNLFTSFGYFETDAEHAVALEAMAQTLRPGGWLALDFLNPGAVRRNLVPKSETTLGGVAVGIERRITDDGRFVLKTIVTPDGQRFVERVRLLEPTELETMFRASGLDVAGRFGDYSGAPLDGQHPRAILVGRRR
jgi:SAM-dependent methyltransferase